LVNEELVGEALAGHRQQVILATKCGLQVPDPSVFHHDASKFSLTRASKRKHLEENLGGTFVQLTEAELTWLDQVPAAVGGRY
jgi:aryl-alcohol dehydrogenase-like predicted oxidoreductase